MKMLNNKRGGRVKELFPNIYLCHAIENKPIRMQKNCCIFGGITSNYHATRVHRIDCVGHCIFYGMVSGDGIK